MNIRHGDLVLIEIDKLPEGLTETNSKIIMTGSGGYDHTFNKGKLYLKNVSQFIIGYFVSEEGTILFHKEHGKIVKGKELREIVLPEKIWEIRKQQRDTHEGMKPVLD